MSTITQIKTAQHNAHPDHVWRPGFKLPSVLPALPTTFSIKGLLDTEQELALGYRMQMLSLRKLSAMAIDTYVIERLMVAVESSIELGSSRSADRAATLVFVDGVWIRIGMVAGEEFTALVLAKINTIRTRIAEVRLATSDCGGADLFSKTAQQRLQAAVCELVPYDYLLNQAAHDFKEHCESLNKECRELVSFVACEFRMGGRRAHKIVCGNWVSPTLYAACAHAEPYSFSLFPVKAKKAFREGLVARQKTILDCATNTGVPVTDMLNSWDAFWLSSRDLDATQELFAKANTGLVEKLVNEYKFVTDLDQVRSAAYFGLIRAISLFAPEKGFRFSTYATTWIRQSILRDIAKQEMISKPEGSHAQLGALRRALNETPNASYKDLAKITGLKLDDVKALMYFVVARNPETMDSAFTSDAGDSEGTHERIADENNNFVENLIEEDAAEFVIKAIGEVLDRRDLDIITSRFGIGGAETKTLVELAGKYSLSTERIRQLESLALKKLRDSDLAEALLELCSN